MGSMLPQTLKGVPYAHIRTTKPTHGRKPTYRWFVVCCASVPYAKRLGAAEPDWERAHVLADYFPAFGVPWRWRLHVCSGSQNAGQSGGGGLGWTDMATVLDGRQAGARAAAQRATRRLPAIVWRRSSEAADEAADEKAYARRRSIVYRCLSHTLNPLALRRSFHEFARKQFFKPAPIGENLPPAPNRCGDDALGAQVHSALPFKGLDAIGELTALPVSAMRGIIAGLSGTPATTEGSTPPAKSAASEEPKRIVLTSKS